MAYRLGIDIGGTFTDFVLLSDEGGLTMAKVLSNPDDLHAVVGSGLELLQAELGLSQEALLGRIELVVHGTTMATNALIQGTLARTGLIATEGFRDILELREGLKEERYNYFTAQPPATIESSNGRSMIFSKRTQPPQVTGLPSACKILERPRRLRGVTTGREVTSGG